MSPNISAVPVFSAKNLSAPEIDEMVQKNILQKPYLFDPARLKILTISYYDFAGEIHNDGQIIVLDSAANYVIAAFQELYRQKFPLQKMRLMNEYNGDDNLAMADNNCSALNQRKITGDGAQLSIHAYGLALDINPIQNPYIDFDVTKGTAQFAPIAGIKFANRLENRSGKQNRQGLAESIKNIFYQNGFNIWGGDWDNPIDYQHFQTSRILAELLITMNSTDAENFFNHHVKFLKTHNEELVVYLKNNFYGNLKVSYNADKTEFMNRVERIVNGNN